MSEWSREWASVPQRQGVAHVYRLTDLGFSEPLGIETPALCGRWAIPDAAAVPRSRSGACKNCDAAVRRSHIIELVTYRRQSVP